LRRSYGASRTGVQEKVALPIAAFSPRYRRLEVSVRSAEKASFLSIRMVAGFVEVAENEDFRGWGVDLNHRPLGYEGSAALARIREAAQEPSFRGKNGLFHDASRAVRYNSPPGRTVDFALKASFASCRRERTADTRLQRTDDLLVVGNCRQREQNRSLTRSVVQATRQPDRDTAAVDVSGV